MRRLAALLLLWATSAGATDYLTIDDTHRSFLAALTSCSTAASGITYNTTTHAFGCNVFGVAGILDGTTQLGSLQIDSTGDSVVDALGYHGTTLPQNQLFTRSTTIAGGDTGVLLDLTSQVEEGGHNNTAAGGGDPAGKTTHNALYVYQTQNTPGQSYAMNVQEIHPGHGDTVGIFAVARGTGAQSEGGDEGSMAWRSESHDYGSTVQGTATFTGGLNPEVLTPSNISEFESDYIGEGQLIVWVEGGTAINLTGYTPTTRTWTYTGGAAAGSTYAGRCVKLDDFDYADDISHTAGSWMYIDSGGAGRTFTTQVRSANNAIVGGPIAYNTVDYSANPPATIAKACNRVVSMQRDPNHDGNFADTTITIAGANWPMPGDFTTNNTQGSCAANCNFEITGEFQQRMHGAKFLTSMRKGTLLSSAIVEAQGTGISTDLKPHWGFVVDGLGAAHAVERGYGCDSGAEDCIEHITATNEADTESFARLQIKENSGLAADKFLRVFEPYLDESGGVSAHTAANINLDLSTDNWSIGPSGSEKRIAVVPTISAASASGNCKTGDLWFRTGTKEIWVCTATNTWTQYP